MTLSAPTLLRPLFVAALTVSVAVAIPTAFPGALSAQTGQAPAAQTESSKSAPYSKSFDGPWDTSYGFMELKTEGKKVIGYYLYDGESSTVEGTMKDARTLEFSYRETGATGSGIFILSEDGQRFQGKWRETGSQAWDAWVGKRPDPDSVGYSGLWETEFGRMRLNQEGKTVTGVYGVGASGTVDGTVENGKLTFTYTEPGVKGEGWFQLEPGGQAFAGKWRGSGTGEWLGWSGERVEAEPGVTWLVVLEANWEESIAEEQYNFGDILKTFFARAPSVRVRHRTFANEDNLRHWLSEVPFLAEPTVVVISSHGVEKGVFGTASAEPIPASAFSDTLKNASNVKLLHLAACLTMKDNYPEQILKGLPADARFPVSGYATSVDWAGSALADMLYYELVLVRGYGPARAFRETLNLLPLAGDVGGKGAEIPALDMRIVMPEAV